MLAIRPGEMPYLIVDVLSVRPLSMPFSDGVPLKSASVWVRPRSVLG